MGNKMLKYSNFNESAKLNRDTYNAYFNRLLNILLSMYEWKGLPDTVDPRFIERTLAHEGKAVFFRDEVMGYLCLQVNINGPLDVYGNPTSRRAYAVNGYTLELDNTNSVMLYNNATRTGSVADLELYASRLYEIERAIDVNVKGQKTPKIITCEESQRLTMRNLYMKYDGNQPFIFADKSLDRDSIKVLDTSSPYVSDNLRILLRQRFSDALAFIGVDSNISDKKERVVAEEVQSNRGIVEAQRSVHLAPRKLAAEQINKMFGLNVTVEFREELFDAPFRRQLMLDSILNSEDERGVEK